MSDSVKQPRQAGTSKTEEIPVTSAMIEAGVTVLCDFNPERDAHFEVALDIYRAMEKRRRLASEGEDRVSR